MFFPKAGPDYDLEHKNGLSEITAYLTEQGAGSLSAEALQEELNQLGTQLEIRVGRQTVSIVLSGLSWHGRKLWDIFQKVLAEPHFKEEELKILRRQFVEKRLKNLDNPSFVASAVWRQRLFKGSVGQDGSGTLISLSKVTLEDIKSFYKNRYLEGEPLLMVVGQYDKELEKHIVSFFNERFSYQDKNLEGFSVPHLEADFRLLTKKDLVQAHVYLGYPISAFPVEDPKKFLALRIANSILGSGDMLSRLFIDLREKKGLTYHVSSDLEFGKLYGVFLVSGSSKTSSVREFLEDSLLILEKFRAEAVSLEEVQRAKQNLRSRYLNRIETPEGQLNQFVYYTYYLGVDSHFSKNYLKILESVSLEDVNNLIKEFVLSKALQVLVYGHPSLQSQLGDIKGLAPLQVMSFEDHFKEELDFHAKK